jgi:hypothetical protein
MITQSAPWGGLLACLYIASGGPNNLHLIYSIDCSKNVHSRHTLAYNGSQYETVGLLLSCPPTKMLKREPSPRNRPEVPRELFANKPLNPKWFMLCVSYRFLSSNSKSIKIS